MLVLRLAEEEVFDEARGEFRTIPGQDIRLEHSLKAVAQWESKWKKPFLSAKEKTNEETFDYVRCMCVDGTDEDTLRLLPPGELRKIIGYINDPMTATTFSGGSRSGRKQVLTAEVIYWMMAEHNIPFTCEDWHLNRLLALLHVCAIKSVPQKKMSAKEAAMRQAALNEKRRAATGSKG